jgi:MFS family permease
MKRRLISNLLGLIGAVIGGVLGFYTFGWLEHHGFYGLAIPGSFLGLGCGLLAQHRSLPRGIVCAVAALALSLFTEWKFHPFNDDTSFTFMLQHVQDLSPVTLLMMAIATFIAFWVGQDAGFGLTPWSRSWRKPEAKPEVPGEQPR